MLRNASLPLSDMANKKDPWSQEDKKMMLGLKPEKLTRRAALVFLHQKPQVQMHLKALIK